MKPAAAFAIGLWTGAVVAAAIGVFYLRIGEGGRRVVSPSGLQKLEKRNQARAETEMARLKQTIADLHAKLEIRADLDSRRQARMVRAREFGAEGTTNGDWIAEAVGRADTLVLPRLEQAALQNDPRALDALALLAGQDNGETMARVWNSAGLSDSMRQRATFLLGATVELNPRAEELLGTLFTTDPPMRPLCEVALAGIATSDVGVSSNDPAAHFRPDYTQRLRVVEGWHASVTDTQLLAVIERVHGKLAERATAEQVPQ